MKEVMAKEKAAIVIDQKDNIAVALTDLTKGDDCEVRSNDTITSVQVEESIPFGHKIALQRLEKNEIVYKYGEEIGKMKEAAEIGSWIHTHNMYCDRGLKNG
ncbi:UxaA family hydrolase [Evansella sp. LMS18]|jgi:altronate dehydratase small subunit|uniref:UxaA family hydrolase n=1 Tax=Evansella sp. LMS18 TaxID=2924033 RepID=UPI0020D13CA5|nr:UxaA family hydrolase [Evansella sp. LMS18]UTR11937.1 UxaA family hydrolase [Evansella sp. LMS18]